MNLMMYISGNLFCSNSSPILELSVKFVYQICHEDTNKPLDGAYLADFGIDIRGVNRALCIDDVMKYILHARAF